MKRIAIATLATALMVAWVQAHAADVIAKSGAIELSATDVQALVRQLPEASRSAVAGDAKTLEQLIRSELSRRAVLAEIRASDFERQPTTTAQLERIREEALVRLWLANRSQPPAAYPSEDDLKLAYEANKGGFTTPSEYRVAQIFVAAPNGIDAVKLAAAIRKVSDLGNLVRTTPDFGKLAREQSEHTESAANGGDMGLMKEDTMLPEIALALRDVEPGKVVGPVKTAQGFHYLKLVEKKPGRVQTLAEVHQQLASALRGRRTQELQQTYVRELSAKLAISINQIELTKLMATLH